MSAPTALEAAREVAQQKLDSALDSMPPRARPHAEIDVQVPISALRALIAATTPPADDVREAAQTFAEYVGWNWDALNPMWRERFEQAARKVLVRARGTVTDAEAQWEYGIRASGDDEPYSDVSEDVDWLIDHFTVGVPDEQIVRRRKAGPWEVRT